MSQNACENMFNLIKEMQIKTMMRYTSHPQGWPQQALIRMWKQWNFYTLQEGMYETRELLCKILFLVKN